MILPIDELIFFKGVETTKQISFPRLWAADDPLTELLVSPRGRFTCASLRAEEEKPAEHWGDPKQTTLKMGFGSKGKQ